MQELCIWEFAGYYPDYSSVNEKLAQVQFVCDELNLLEPIINIHVFSWGTRVAIASDPLVLNYVEPVHISDYGRCVKCRFSHF
jgi:hypothetical protein